MRILYIDIDTLRADHLGCYGYHRDTSPNIDRLAAHGVRFDNVYASDVPCLPSRTALITGKFGTRNGVVGHGGTTASLHTAGPGRGFRDDLPATSWAACLARAGHRTATISSFASRHSAYHWHAGFDETYDPGKLGMETADEVTDLALDWLQRNAEVDDWFLHVHLWDPHTPYRTPSSYGEPFADEPLPDWLTEEVRSRDWLRPGPHSPQEALGFSPIGEVLAAVPRQPDAIASMDDVRRLFDGYDTGVRYADDHVGRLLDALAGEQVLDETAILVSADHGETLGELGVYGDHQTADHQTAHLPAVLSWPGLTPQVDGGLHYHLDVAATIVDLAGGRVPKRWDGTSLAGEIGGPGRDELVITQGAWTAQRGVRFDHWLCIRTRHDGFHAYPETMLFDLDDDPHEQRNLAADRPDVVRDALARLERWHTGAMARSASDTDPLDTVMEEGGPWHARDHLPEYLGRLRETGRTTWADHLERRPLPVG